MLLNLAKRIFVLLLCGLAINAVAHRYFFSMTDLTLNERTQSIEVIHQITAHDIDNAIAESKQIHFSVAHPNYENIIRQYVEAHLSRSGVRSFLDWTKNNQQLANQALCKTGQYR
jgi:BioD-like phosphotransacetylase family protein